MRKTPGLWIPRFIAPSPQEGLPSDTVSWPALARDSAGPVAQISPLGRLAVPTIGAPDVSVSTKQRRGRYGLGALPTSPGWRERPKTQDGVPVRMGSGDTSTPRLRTSIAGRWERGGARGGVRLCISLDCIQVSVPEKLLWQAAWGCLMDLRVAKLAHLRNIPEFTRVGEGLEMRQRMDISLWHLVKAHTTKSEDIFFRGLDLEPYRTLRRNSCLSLHVQARPVWSRPSRKPLTSQPQSRGLLNQTKRPRPWSKLTSSMRTNSLCAKYSLDVETT